MRILFTLLFVIGVRSTLCMDALHFIDKMLCFSKLLKPFRSIENTMIYVHVTIVMKNILPVYTCTLPWYTLKIRDMPNSSFKDEVASWWMRSPLEEAAWVRTLVVVTVLCSWARHITLTVLLSTQVPANWMLGVALQWTSIPSKGE